MEKIPLEVQPSFEADRIFITVEYRGGSPGDVEKSVILPIESALEGLSGSIGSSPAPATAVPVSPSMPSRNGI
jgi:multidrug efflux pump subunit AcrB